MARRANHNLAAARAQLKQAETNTDQAFTALFPTLTAQGKYTRNNKQAAFPLPGSTTALVIQPYNQLDASLNFTSLLFSPAVYTGLKAIEAGVDASRANLEASEDDILLGVAQTFYQCAVADEVLVARASSIEVARATLEKANVRFNAGTVTKVDVDRAELALLQAEQGRRDAELGRSQSYRALATLTGAADGSFRAVAPAPVTSPPAAVDMDMVLRLRPEFRALEATVRADDLDRRTNVWRWAPSLSAFGNARRFNYKNFAADDYSWAVGASLDWVIYDSGTRDVKRRLAMAEVEEALARAAVLRDSIRDDLANGRHQLETKTQAVETAERQVALARETVELVRTQYEAGVVTQVDLLQAQDNLVSAQVALAQAHFDVALADLTVRRAAGTFPGR